MQKIKISIAKVQIGICACLFLVLIFLLVRMPSVNIIDQDEITYISGATVFSEINSVKARTMIAEDVSKYMEADWYGPFYNIFYGSVMKVFGPSAKVFIFINAALLLLLVLLITTNNYLGKTTKIYAIAFLLASPLLVNYFYFLMPMALNVFFIMLLALYLIKINHIYLQPDNKTSITKHILIYALLVLFFALFRATFAFAIVGILPFATKKTFLKYSVLILFVVGTSFLFMNFFTAPPYAKNVSTLQYLLKFDLPSFFKGFFAAMQDNLLNKFPRKLSQMKDVAPPLLFSYYFIFLTPFYFTYRYFKKANKLLLAFSLICLASNIISTLFYLLTPHFFLRLSVPLFALLCFVIAADEDFNVKLKNAFCIILLAFTLLSFRKAVNEAEVRGRIVSGAGTELFNSLTALAQQPVTTILIDRNFSEKFPDRGEFFYKLPYVGNGHLIRYTVNVYEKNPLFIHNKIKVDYILTGDSLNKENFSYFRSNKLFRLYKSNL